MIRRTSIFLVICAVLLMGVMQIAKAQDEAPAVSGFILLSGTSGTLEEGDDDVYELTLEEVRPNAVWVLNAPQYFSGWYDTALLASHWAANTETPLTATVLLQTETVTLRMTASQPAYDPMLGTLTLQVSAIEAFPVEEEKGKKKKGSGIPDEFELADLTIVLDTAFNDGLEAGYKLVTSEGRGPSDNPPPPTTKPLPNV